MSAATRQDAVKEALWFVKCFSALWDDEQAMQLAVKGDGMALHGSGFILPEIAHAEFLRQHRKELGNGARIDAALQAIMAAVPVMFARLFDAVGFGSGDDDPPHDRAKDEALRDLIESLGQLDLRPSSLGERAVLGDAVEYVIHQTASVSGPKLWMFTSPREIAQFVAALVAPASGDDIFDPACGAGGFLVACTEARMLAAGQPGTVGYSGRTAIL